MTTSTRDTKDQVRAGFEEWFRIQCEMPTPPERIGDGYVTCFAQSAWKVWQAATQHKAEQDTVAVSNEVLNAVEYLQDKDGVMTHDDYLQYDTSLKIVCNAALGVKP